MFHAATIGGRNSGSISKRLYSRGEVWHRFGCRAPERRPSMKLFLNHMDTNAKTKLTFALCTVLALSVASQRAADQDRTQGGTGTATEAGQAGKLSRTDEKFIKDAAKGGRMEVHMGKLG